KISFLAPGTRPTRLALMVLTPQQRPPGRSSITTVISRSSRKGASFNSQAIMTRPNSEATPHTAKPGRFRPGFVVGGKEIYRVPGLLPSVSPSDQVRLAGRRAAMLHGWSLSPAGLERNLSINGFPWGSRG